MSDERSESAPAPEGPPARPLRRGGPALNDPTAFSSHMRNARSEFEHQMERARVEFEEANERINARSGRNLFMAILIGVGIGVVVLGSLLFVKWAFIAFAVPLCLLGIFEFDHHAYQRLCARGSQHQPPSTLKRARQFARRIAHTRHGIRIETARNLDVNGVLRQQRQCRGKLGE